MSRIESYTEETDWTKDDLKKLLTAVKGGISEEDRMDIYTKGMETIDWRKVAFPPFPPEACQEKMIEILEQMRKTRTLTELIVEAEGSICGPVQNEMGECEEQRQPPAEEDNRSPLNLRKRKSGAGDAQEQGNECEDDEEGRPAKPPWNGYILFCKEKMASRPKGSKTPQWSQLWRDLTKMERQEYNSRSKELRSRYSVQLNRYLLSSDPEAQRLLNNHGTEKSRGANREKTFPDEPKMPAAAANSAFMKEQMKLLKDKVPDTKRRFSCCCSRWKNLPAEEKERYRESADEDLRRFWKELQSWFETLRPAEQKLYLALNPGKMKYLDVEKAPAWKRKEIPCRPSDSEDEDIEDSSSEEEEDGSSCEEEGEAADEDVMFEMYRW